MLPYILRKHTLPVVVENFLDILSKIVLEYNSKGSVYLVGGWVRDHFIYDMPDFKDIDIEIFGISDLDIDKVLAKTCNYYVAHHEPGNENYPTFEKIGRSFPVYMLKLWDKYCGVRCLDISIPRTEWKSGEGHTGFKVIPDPELSFTEASVRRDFTVNAIGYNWTKQEFDDPFNGVSDIKNKKLRVVSSKFKEDPLRVFRGMQLIGRFGFTPDDELIDMCKSIEDRRLPAERIHDEFYKLFTKGLYVGKGLEFLNQTGWISMFPELEAIVGCPQKFDHHPEGCVWTHTKMVCDAIAYLRYEQDDIMYSVYDPDFEDIDWFIIGLGGLLHDIGKPETVDPDNHYSTQGHAKIGADMASTGFLKAINVSNEVHDAVSKLIVKHMIPHQGAKLTDNGQYEMSDKAIVRLIKSVGKKYISHLQLLSIADGRGRFPKPPRDIDNENFASRVRKVVEKMEEIENRPKPLFGGYFFINQGVKPGPKLGDLIDEVYEYQLLNPELSLEEIKNYALKLIKEIV